MKKIIKPHEKEQATYYSDFSGKYFGEWIPPVELKIEFNYGSKYDGSEISLHLSDEEIELLLDVIKLKMSNDYKQSLKKQLAIEEKEYCESVDFRDWESCEQKQNSVHLIEYLLDIEQN
jgi:hypothetical protein